ncbi:15785_t:CDS:2, partial [Entrophospora sp. SA101]
VSDAFDYIRSSLEMDVLNVEDIWLTDATKNLESLKNEVHK